MIRRAKYITALQRFDLHLNGKQIIPFKARVL